MNVLFYRREVLRSYSQMDSAEMLGYVLFWMEYSLREKDVCIPFSEDLSVSEQNQCFPIEGQNRSQLG